MKIWRARVHMGCHHGNCVKIKSAVALAAYTLRSQSLAPPTRLNSIGNVAKFELLGKTQIAQANLASGAERRIALLRVGTAVSQIVDAKMLSWAVRPRTS